MFRFFYIIGILTKYLSIYLLLKFGLYRKPKEKILRNFFEEAGGAFVKFGQLLALRVDVLPKEYALEMIGLFDVPLYTFLPKDRIIEEMMSFRLILSYVPLQFPISKN